MIFMNNFTILLIDDEPAQLTSIKAFLKKRNNNVYTAESGKQGLELLYSHTMDCIFTDFRMPDMNGLDVVKRVKKYNPDIPVVVITAFSQIEDAVNVMKEGAFDYLTKPIELDELELLLKKIKERSYLISENKMLREQLHERYKFDSIVSQSKDMEEVLNTSGRVAKSNTTVLIRGESGTGKELIARVIHYASNRSDKPLVTVNCAALSEHLLESELFGHEKGAFTGAFSSRIGRFEQADKSTLFIDEIGDIPVQTQVKLLRVLQFGEFERVGSSDVIKVDVRIIAATNRNLEEMIKNKLFREDLYYRINVVSITLPPLRERKSDIKPLIDHFIKKIAKENRKDIKGMSKEAYNTLIQYNFPGNVRELENIIERAVVLSREAMIITDDLPSEVSINTKQEILDPYNFINPFPEKIAAFESVIIKEALKIKRGNQSKAAQLLGITERHLRSRMQKHSIINN
jgi:two-component system NtrC family response regulator